MKAFPLGTDIHLDEFVEVAERARRVRLKPEARAGVRKGRRALLRAAGEGTPIYGVNTGFGELAARRIPPESIRVLQENLVLSHACGVGDPLSEAEARGMLLLRANEMARGHSGCRPELIEALAAMLNRGVTPIVPSRGSVGASGDLAPQAHAALVLLGKGKARYRGRVMSGARALAAAGLKPLRLGAKEGLCLINGTQAMQAVGGLSLARAFHVLEAADLAGAMGNEAIKGTPAPYDARVSMLKPHPGQVRTATRLRRLLRGSQIRESHRFGDYRVQDPYSFRCMPQVHGAAMDALESVRRTLEIEMRSVTDNPLIDARAVLSGGNFHGAALALAFDHAAAAMAVLGGISERRIFQVVSGMGPGLPPFWRRIPGWSRGS
ncbi:MAG: aromatic amino acid ammonia-lyase [Elusimicrobiota bacterium]